MLVNNGKSFKLNPGEKQKGIVEVHDLQPEELALIEDIVNWNTSSDAVDHIYDVCGRSIFLKSPLRTIVNGNSIFESYQGLQLIGAGGNWNDIKGALHTGYVERKKENIILPVDANNHKKELESIVQLRKIDENGMFQYSYRDYVPLHGMDKQEADSRMKYTYSYAKAILYAEEINAKPNFVVPEPVLHGSLVDKCDLSGESLKFQVYRVPIIHRLPGQASDIVFDEPKNLFGFIAHASARMGNALRVLHTNNLAYMDSHTGNIGLMEDNSLYITDLGSILNFDGVKHGDNYRGFDMMMFMTTMKQMLEFEGNHQLEFGGRKDELDVYFSKIYETSCVNVFRSYFSKEVDSGKLSHRDIGVLLAHFTFFTSEYLVDEFASAFSVLPYEKFHSSELIRRK